MHGLAAANSDVVNSNAFPRVVGDSLRQLREIKGCLLLPMEIVVGSSGAPKVRASQCKGPPPGVGYLCRLLPALWP